MIGAIKDIEYYLPSKVLSNDDLAKLYLDWNAEKIYKKVGIKFRHIAEEDETAVDLAIKAALKLLQKNDGLNEKIDFVVLCTQSPDYLLPTSACIIQERLGLSKSCGAFDFNLGCSGFIYGLAIAKGLLSSGIAKNILLIMAETYSKHIHPMDKSVRTIFGDGAAAIWIANCNNQEYIGEFVLGTDGSGAINLIIPSGGQKLQRDERTRLEYSDENNNIRSQDHLYMNGSEIFNFTIKTVPQLVIETLNKNKLTLNEVDYFIFHQANKYMLEHLREKIGISNDKFYINLENIGNTVSASIPIALVDTCIKGVVKKGNKVMLVGFGVGYSWGACIIGF